MAYRCPGHLLCVSCLFSNNSQFLSGYFLFAVCFTVSGTFMTALCLYNNISRHIKITFMVLNFVTEILQQFPRIENNVWILNFVTEISSNFALKKIKIRFLVLITLLETYSQNEASLVRNNVKFYTKPILLFS